MKSYQKRLIEQLLLKFIPLAPVILVEGAKAVGKTETCKKLSKTIYNLDKENQRQLLSLEPEIIQNDAPPVLIDEWQNVPELWNSLRRQVDDGLPKGSVILTGSSPRFYKDLHSGSGRIIKFKMRPYSIQERNMSDEYISIYDLLMGQTKIDVKRVQLSMNDYIEEIYKSGFPGIRVEDDDFIIELLNGYIDNIITHEFQENGLVIKKPVALMEWLRAFASVNATNASFSSIIQIAMSNSLEAPTRITGNYYREALELLNIIEEVPTWLPIGKLTKNLAKTPKHFMLDTALMTTLLNVKKEDLAYARVPKEIGKYNKTFLGQIFESFVYQSLRVYADIHRADLSHLRTSQGDREIDFIMQLGRKLLAIEVKAKISIDNDDIKHLIWFEEQVKEEYQVTKIIVYAGEFAYTREDGVHLIPACLLGL